MRCPVPCSDCGEWIELSDCKWITDTRGVCLECWEDWQEFKKITKEELDEEPDTITTT